MSGRNLRGQAAYCAEQMRYFRLRVAEANHNPALWMGLPDSFAMNPAGRRRGFESWRARHAAIVAKMRRLP